MRARALKNSIFVSRRESRNGVKTLTSPSFLALSRKSCNLVELKKINKRDVKLKSKKVNDLSVIGYSSKYSQLNELVQ